MKKKSAAAKTSKATVKAKNISSKSVKGKQSVKSASKGSKTSVVVVSSLANDLAAIRRRRFSS